MPELPEVETITRDLRRRIPGHRIVAVDVVHADVLAPTLDPALLDVVLRGRRIENVSRRGKNVVLELDDGGRVVVNLGMTGRLVAADSPRAVELDHVAVRFALDRHKVLLYDDTRRFGRIDLFGPDAWEHRSAELGIEPFSELFTPALLYGLLQRSRTPVRNWLLDQNRVAGIGNIYANEALFRSGVRPDRPANRLSRREAARLRDALRGVLEEAIAARGTTISDYRDAEGEVGDFAVRLRVYGRAGEPCITCSRRIERAVLSNRPIFYCPRCQR